MKKWGNGLLLFPLWHPSLPPSPPPSTSHQATPLTRPCAPCALGAESQPSPTLPLYFVFSVPWTNRRPDHHARGAGWLRAWFQTLSSRLSGAWKQYDVCESSPELFWKRGLQWAIHNPAPTSMRMLNTPMGHTLRSRQQLRGRPAGRAATFEPASDSYNSTQKLLPDCQ